MLHIPVLEKETLDLLLPERGGIFVDATLGLGGHSHALLERVNKEGKTVRLIGIDQDEQALLQAKKRLSEKMEYIRGNFADIAFLLRQAGIDQVNGILMDLGVSSYQIDTQERGFSFQAAGPLDMRMDKERDITAADIVNTWPEPKLTEIFYKYGEERLGRKIARLIVERRKKELFTDTLDLVELVVSAYPPPARYKHPHPATRVFQALRIAVNEELEVLEEGLQGALSMLAPQGRLVVISFHSLEDRIVKHYFRQMATDGGFELLTKKPIEASQEEKSLNPRSRSAKVRGIQKVA